MARQMGSLAYGVRAAGLAVLAGCWGMLSCVPPPEPVPPRSVPALSLLPSPPEVGKLVGNRSCATGGCHGSSEPAQPPLRRGDEYAVWLHRDPHSRAYAALLSREGQAIGRRLGLMNSAEAAECLACHVNPKSVAANPDRELWADGVSCEACHGPASGWRAEHARSDWARLDDQARLARGMTPILSRLGAANPTARVVERARVCASCHVGAPAGDGLPLRDVNHDMLAAGHPRLTFEYASYLANLPPHWRSVQPPDAEGWAVGQAATAEAALRLLSFRAGNAEQPRPDPFSTGSLTVAWPEFAEFDCFACHHDLDPRTGAQRRERMSAGKVGALASNRWPLAMLGDAVRYLTNEKPAALVEKLDELKTILAQPHSPAAAAEKAGAAAEHLGQVRAELSRGNLQRGSADYLRNSWLLRYESDPARIENGPWDEAAQLYLALTATAGGKPEPPVLRLLEQLRFEQGLSSPRGRFPSPNGGP